MNLADLIALEAIALKTPAVYQHIRDLPAAYLGTGKGIMALRTANEITADFADARKQALDTVPARLRSAVKQLLAALFPATKDHQSWTSAESAQRRGLISSEDRLIIALSAGLPTGEASYNTAVNFLRNPEMRSEALDEIKRSGHLARFVEHLRLAERETDCKQLPDLVRFVGRLLDSPIEAAAGSRPDNLFSGFEDNIWSLIDSLLEKTPLEERTQLIITILQDADLLSIGVRLLGKLQLQHRGSSDQAPYPEDQRWVDSTLLKEITSKWEAIVRVQINTGKLFDAMNAGRIFYYLKRFRPDILTDTMDGVIGSDAAFDRFISAIAERGISSAHGKYLTIRDSNLDEFGDLKKIKARAQERLRDPNLTGETRCAMQAVIDNGSVYISGMTVQ